MQSVDKFNASPNYDERPSTAAIDTLVIHAISLPPDTFGNAFVEEFFTNKLDANQHPYFAKIAHLRVSAHFYIKRCGTVIQFVDIAQRARHAGESWFDGQSDVNDFSIGIELEGCDTLPFTRLQYQKLALVSNEIRAQHPLITQARIVGHNQIAPGRKTDPGPCFDWQYYLSLLATNRSSQSQ